MTVYFIIDLSEETIQQFEQNSIDQNWHLFTKGRVIWTVQTYLVLKSMGLDVQLSNTLKPNAINISHAEVLSQLKPQKDCFIVSMRADKYKIPWAQLEVVQNQNQTAKKRFYVPHWPQPGLIKRDSQRRGVKTIAFAGFVKNSALDSAQFNQKIEPHGITYTELKANQWNRYDAIDVLVAVRRFGRKHHNTKPPSKLINAWFANIPLIAGYDSAYTQIGTPGVDFIQVSNEYELVEAIITLKTNPEYYQSIVRQGQEKSKAYTRDKIGQTWHDLMTTQIIPRYKNTHANHPLIYYYHLCLYQALKWRLFISDYINRVIKHIRRHYIPKKRNFKS